MKSKIQPKNRKSGYVRANKGQAIRDLTKGRECSHCKIYKDRDCFYEHPSGFNGLGPRCIKCCSEIGKSPTARAVKKKLYDNRRNSYSCVACGSKELVSGVHCTDCWFADKAYRRAGGMKNLASIRALWDCQSGRCFYSEEKLVPGKNASLDHQIPTSRGGADDPSNLKWVTNNINIMKSDMTHAEFIEMCQQISIRFKDIN